MNSAPGFDLDDRVIAELSEQYFDCIQDIVARINTKGDDKIPLEDVMVSDRALSLAFAEAAKDLEIMHIRRRPKSGISSAKIAGVITFRLSRFAPIQLAAKTAENDLALKLNALVPFALAMKAIMHKDITNFDSKVSREIQYTLARRHTNQETLGLVYEILQ